MKIRALSAESVCCRHRLGLKAVSANRTAQNDLPQRRHVLSPLLAIFHQKKFLCHLLLTSLGINALVQVFMSAYFLASRSALRSLPPPATWLLMLINLLPDFFAVLNSTDRIAAYLRYFDNHRSLLEAYWANYVVEPDSPHFSEVVRSAALAGRSDLRTMLERMDVVTLARNTEDQCKALLEADSNIDVVLMVGVGAANAGELVVEGRGVAFVCLEHFTSVANPETRGLGLDPELIPLWLSHEIAHGVRYTSPSSHSEMRTIVDEMGGYYSYWETGKRATLRELLINEGIAVHVSRIISPGHASWEYYGYDRREYARIREMGPVVARSLMGNFEKSGLGLRLKYLSDGMSEDSRRVGDFVVPERCGYYVGAKMVEQAIALKGASWTVRASTSEIAEVSGEAAASA